MKAIEWWGWFSSYCPSQEKELECSSAGFLHTMELWVNLLLLPKYPHCGKVLCAERSSSAELTVLFSHNKPCPKALPTYEKQSCFPWRVMVKEVTSFLCQAFACSSESCDCPSGGNILWGRSLPCCMGENGNTGS